MNQITYLPNNNIQYTYKFVGFVLRVLDLNCIFKIVPVYGWFFFHGNSVNSGGEKLYKTKGKK